jgi:hypothetical protein
VVSRREDTDGDGGICRVDLRRGGPCLGDACDGASLVVPADADPVAAFVCDTAPSSPPLPTRTLTATLATSDCAAEASAWTACSFEAASGWSTTADTEAAASAAASFRW